jgi:hypothetical protein
LKPGDRGRPPTAAQRVRPASRAVERSTMRMPRHQAGSKRPSRRRTSSGLYMGAALGERGTRRLPRKLISGAVAVAVIAVVVIVAISGAGQRLWHQAGVVAGKLHIGEAEVVVSGNRYLSDQEVLTAAGLEERVSFFDVDLESATASLGQNARVRAVQLDRRFNGKIRVRIEERIPVAVISGGDLREVDCEGRVLPQLLKGAVADLPVIRGLDSPRDGTLEDSDFHRALQWLEALAQPGIGLCGRISEVDVGGSGETRIILDPDGIPVLLPTEPGSLESLCALRVVLADLESRSIKAIRIDCRANGMVVVRPAPGTYTAKKTAPVAARPGGAAVTL